MFKPCVTLVAVMIPCLVGVNQAFPFQASGAVRIHRLSRAGQSLSAAQAKKMEGIVAKSPDDMDARIQLVSYYWPKQYTDPAARDEHAKHVLWIIENRPESAFTEQPQVVLHSRINPVAYRRGAELWRAHAAKDNASTTILSNAASYFRFSDRDVAESYFKRCCELEPDNAKWFAALGHLYHLSSSGKALEAYEAALEKSDGRQRYNLLASVAKAATDVGKFDKAKKYALMLLEASVEQPGAGWNYGNAVHHGNLVLGHVALHGDQIDEAEAYLLKAGKTPGSPQLNSFGPNMSLALALLKRDRKKAVIEYLKLCGKFWKKTTTDAWIKEIEEGRTPNFGANLRY